MALSQWEESIMEGLIVAKDGSTNFNLKPDSKFFHTSYGLLKSIERILFMSTYSMGFQMAIGSNYIFLEGCTDWQHKSQAFVPSTIPFIF